MDPQASPTTTARPPWLEPVAIALLVALSCWLIFAQLGAASFHDGDEALYASVAAEMEESGELLTPRFWGAPLLNKPPLMYWLMTASMRCLPGTLEWRARFPSALMGLALLALVYLVARRLGGVWSACAAVLLLLGNHQFLFEHSVRSANLDAGLATLMFAAIVFGARAHSCKRDRVLSALCCACVLMVKLPLAIFVVPTLFVYLWRQERRAAWRWLAWAAGCALLIAVPWHAYSLVVHGREFWDVYVGYEILGRTGQAITDRDATWWMHLLAFWKSFMPWGPLLSLGALAALCGWPKDTQERATLRLLAGYAAFILLFFCFISSKWPWYAIPAYPALAVLGAVFVHDLLRSSTACFAPLLVGASLGVRFAMVAVNGDYAPAARAAHQWPLHAELYSFGFGAGEGVLAALSPLLFVCALAPCIKRLRIPIARATLLLAAMGLGLTITTIARVPRAFEASTSTLCRTLAEHEVDRVFTLGFWAPETYGGRQGPLTSVYFLNLPGADAVDLHDSLAGLVPQLTEHSALVIHRGVMQPELRRTLANLLRGVQARPAVWVLDPSPGGEFRRLELP